MCSILARNTNLFFADFSLDRNDEITDGGLVSLGESIDSLTFLQKLKLHFDNCKFVTGGVGFNKISEGLKSLSSLKQVYLNFQGSFNRKKTRFNFTRCEQITDLGLQKMSQSFTKLISVEELFLKFCGYEIHSGSFVIAE